jgi:predicted HicB family RNase H-like nuclease
MPKRIYGHTKSGKPIDDEIIETLAEEAERGYTAEQLRDRPRGRGRPPLGAVAKTVESVRLDPALRDEAARRADADGISVSEVIRRALRAYLTSA